MVKGKSYIDRQTYRRTIQPYIIRCNMWVVYRLLFLHVCFLFLFNFVVVDMKLDLNVSHFIVHLGVAENGFMFNGKSQFVTSQNVQNVTGKSQL